MRAKQFSFSLIDQPVRSYDNDGDVKGIIVSNLKAGIGRVDFTPPAGLPLMGNLRDDYASRGIHDSLFSRAVVFENSSGQKASLLTLDICMLDREQARLMRRFIEERCGIPGDSILIAATHTHSGPATMELYTCPKAEDDMIAAFLEKAAEAAVIANRDLKEADINIGLSSEKRLSFNRRLKCRDGKTHMNWESLEPGAVLKPLGPVDPQVVVLDITQEQKKKAAVISFALHPAIIDYENSLYSADYPGYLAEGMRSIIEDDFISLFFNGCCGNINHIDHSDENSPRRGYVMAQRVGYMLAASVKKAMNVGVSVSGDSIGVSSELVTLDRLKISEETYKWSLAAVKKMEESPSSEITDGLPVEYCAPVWIDMYKKQNTDDRVEVMALRIGDIGIVGFPGEMFCELGLEVKKQSPAKHTIVIELANDGIGYIPDRKAFGQGGYEDTPGSTKYIEGSGEKLVSSALRQLNTLFKS